MQQESAATSILAVFWPMAALPLLWCFLLLNIRPVMCRPENMGNGSLVWFALHFDSSGIFLDNSVYNGQSEPSSFSYRFGGARVHEGVFPVRQRNTANMIHCVLKLGSPSAYLVFNIQISSKHLNAIPLACVSARTAFSEFLLFLKTFLKKESGVVEKKSPPMAAGTVLKFRKGGDGCPRRPRCGVVFLTTNPHELTLI